MSLSAKTNKQKNPIIPLYCPAPQLTGRSAVSPTSPHCILSPLAQLTGFASYPQDWNISAPASVFTPLPHVTMCAPPSQNPPAATGATPLERLHLARRLASQCLESKRGRIGPCYRYLGDSFTSSFSTAHFRILYRLGAQTVVWVTW